MDDGLHRFPHLPIRLCYPFGNYSSCDYPFEHDIEIGFYIFLGSGAAFLTGKIRLLF